MKFRVSQRVPVFHMRHQNYLSDHRRSFAFLIKKLRTTTKARGSINGGGGGSSKGDSYLVPGATVATILMLGALHARRLYDDKKTKASLRKAIETAIRVDRDLDECGPYVEEAHVKGVEPEFQPDVKAKFMRMLPLRSMSRCWGYLTSMEVPVWLRPHLYKAWARAFHSNLEEVALPLDEYTSLREFFVRTLKEGSRLFDPDPQCLASPVDGTILRFGELKGTGAMIEQVKGLSYSTSTLLGVSSLLPMMAEGSEHEESSEQENSTSDRSKKSWWKITLASPKRWDPVTACPVKGLFYCVIYLKPGDYHRIHSPVDWQVLVRRHFSGNLLPMNERAVRTFKNLYVENERVVLEGLWREGFMAIAAIGATNIGSIELLNEPGLRTNRPRRKLPHSEPPDERVYEPQGVGIMLKKGDEVAAFNMGSTVVLIFQAPISKPYENDVSGSEFKFSVKRGDRIRAGEALGRWST